MVEVQCALQTEGTDLVAEDALVSF